MSYPNTTWRKNDFVNIRDHCCTGHFLKLKILKSQLQNPKVEDI